MNVRSCLGPLLCLSMMACSKTDGATKATASPPPPKQDIKIAVNGKAVDVQSAFVFYTENKRKLTIEFVDKPQPCPKEAELSDVKRPTLTVRQALNENAELEWVVAPVFGEQAAPTRLKLSGSPAKGKTLSGNIIWEAKRFKSKVRFEGSFEAIGCGQIKSFFGSDTSFPNGDLKLSVGAHTFPVRGLVEKLDGQNRTLELYSVPMECRGAAMSEFYIGFELAPPTPGAAPTKVVGMSSAGPLFPGSIGGSAKGKGTITYMDDGKIAIDGTWKGPKGLDLKLKGAMKPTSCP